MRARWAIAVAIAVLLLCRLPAGRCQGIGGRVNPPQTAPLLLQLQSTVDRLTRNIFPAVKENFGSCIKDPCVSSNPRRSFVSFLSFVWIVFDLEARCGFGGRGLMLGCCWIVSFRQHDWDHTFNYTKDLDFLGDCADRTPGMRCPFCVSF